jgi:hypothetical protein
MHFTSRALEFFLGTWALTGGEEKANKASALLCSSRSLFEPHDMQSASLTMLMASNYVANFPVVRFSVLILIAVI